MSIQNPGGTLAATGNVRHKFALDHKKFEEEIPDFLADRLGNDALGRFLDHYDECPMCRDELSIQYLVRAGLPKLETGENFNLQAELDTYLDEERLRLNNRRRLRNAAYFLEVVTLLSCMAAIVIISLFL